MDQQELIDFIRGEIADLEYKLSTITTTAPGGRYMLERAYKAKRKKFQAALDYVESLDKSSEADMEEEDREAVRGRELQDMVLRSVEMTTAERNELRRWEVGESI